MSTMLTSQRHQLVRVYLALSAFIEQHGYSPMSGGTRPARPALE
jgi:hypothetical protein